VCLFINVILWNLICKIPLLSLLSLETMSSKLNSVKFLHSQPLHHGSFPNWITWIIFFFFMVISQKLNVRKFYKSLWKLVLNCFKILVWFLAAVQMCMDAFLMSKLPTNLTQRRQKSMENSRSILGVTSRNDISLYVAK